MEKNPLRKEWITICTSKCLTVDQLKWAKYFVPNLKCIKNKYGKDLEGFYHTCYCIINLINGKCYFGKHSFLYDPSKYRVSKYKGSNEDFYGSHLKNSMLRYGLENFRMLILRYFPTEKAAYDYETKLITLEMIKSKYCYNRQGGGRGFSSGISNPMRVLDKDGNTLAAIRSKNGTHNFCKDKNGDSINRIRSKNGTLHCLGTKPWNAPTSTDDSRYTWYFSEEFYLLANKFPNKAGDFLISVFNEIFKKEYMTFNLKVTSVRKMLKKFKHGWIPASDISWKIFKLEFSTQQNLLAIQQAEAKIKSYKHVTFLPWLKKISDSSKIMWSLADTLYKGYTRKEMSQYSCYRNFKPICLSVLKENFDSETYKYMLSAFKNGWVPSKDKNWRLFDRTTMKKVKAKTEEDLFKALGLKYIEPKERV